MKAERGHIKTLEASIMRKKRIPRSLLAAFLAITLLFVSFMEIISLAIDAGVVGTPQKYQVSDIGYVQSLGKKDWYADLKWDEVTFPSGAEDKYVTLGLNEVESGTGKLITDAIRITLPGSTTSHRITEYSPETIKRGTIYESYARASAKVVIGSSQYELQSLKSNPIKFLTGLHVTVSRIPGTNHIKISWDDVWDTTGRINYRILISDTKSYTQPQQIPDIVASEIGKPGSPVVVNAAEKKLEYVYKFAQPGREYAIKVVPLPSSVVACATAEEIEAVIIKTDILLKAQKVGYTNNGDVIWRLFWNPIVKGDEFERVEYELWRYTNDDVDGQSFRLIPEKDSYEIIIAKDDTNSYSFKVDAKAYKPGVAAPVEFYSNTRVALKEQVPEYPTAPDLIDSFPSADPAPLNYEDLLTSTGATVMWKAPYTTENLLDTDITYDIYLAEDIRDVANPPDSLKIASDMTMGAGNQIKDINNRGSVIGYRYDLAGLKSNATYYFIIQAKKNYLVANPSDGTMVSTEFISKRSVKVIITKPDTGTDRPVAPYAPPFAVQLDKVEYTKATLELQKKWYALYNSDTGKWEYVTKGVYDDNQVAPPATKKDSKIVNYAPGWKVVPHVVKLSDALKTVSDNNGGRDHINYSDLSQQYLLSFQIPQQPAVIPDIPEDTLDQRFAFDITGLEDNTVYLVWVTIENQNGVPSDPSDPLIITTPPRLPDKPVIPTVPTDLDYIAGDNFVDLFWSVKPGMNYEIKCGIEDDVGKATITATVSYEQFLNSTYFRLNGLSPDTYYYVWIRAISTSADGSQNVSAYSNSKRIKTEAYKPPMPPTGFGVKTGADGVTESSITYVWVSRNGFKYYLEFADNINFQNSREIEVSGTSYTVTGLIANRRYYARLYAYENRTGLRSQPTGAIMVITNKSRDEYDGSYDLDDLPTGDALFISPQVKDGVWKADSTGINAHRLSEQVRELRSPVVQIDLSQPPARTSRVQLDLGAVLIDTLAELKMELYVRLPSADIVIRPDSLQNDEYYKLKSANANFSLRFEAVSPAADYKASADLKLLTPVTLLNVGAVNAAPFKSFARPVRVDLPVSGLSAYKAGQISAYRYDGVKKIWTELPTTTRYETGRVSGELSNPGAVMAATKSVASTSTIPVAVKNALDNIQSVFKLNALSGKTFNANASITQAEVMKLILDVVPTTYAQDNYLSQAVKSGMISSFSQIQDGFARRDQAIFLLVSLYRYKTRESVSPGNPAAWSTYTDFGKAKADYVNALKFAIENGISQGNGSTLIYPDRMVTYGEFIQMLEKTLRLCGEL